MAFDPTSIPPRMNHWTPEGIMTCMEEVDKEIDFGERYGAGAIFRMQLDCAVWCLVGALQTMAGNDKLTIISNAEEAADDMMGANGVPFMDEVILRQVMADIFDSAEEAARRWGE